MVVTGIKQILLYFKTFQVYSSYLKELDNYIKENNFKTFQVYSSFILSKINQSILKYFKTFQVYSSLQQKSCTRGGKKISKLFKFIVHVKAIINTVFSIKFQNFSSL